MKNTQTVESKSSLTRNGSNIYLENECNFRIEDEIAYCEHYKCDFKTNDFFEAEDHWHKIHQVW